MTQKVCGGVYVEVSLRQYAKRQLFAELLLDVFALTKVCGSERAVFVSSFCAAALSRHVRCERSQLEAKLCYSM